MAEEQKAILESPDNATLQEDIDQIAEAFPFAGDFSGKTVLVTGSTGLIGSQVVKAFAAINRKKDTAVRILAQARNEKKAEKVFGTLLKRGDVELVIGDVQEQLPIDGGVDFIVHGAAPTGSRFFVEKPVETIHAILGGTESILGLAKDKQVSAMVFLSSLEVYGTPHPQQEWMGEADFGSLDPAKVRSSYSEGKRMAECLCVSYAKEYGVPVIPARLSQTFGPGVDYADNRVFMDFARCALEGRDVVLHTEGRTVRTYLYTKDAVMAILYLLARGEAGQPYNVTNRDTAVSIREMAELVCDTVGEGKIRVKIDIPEDVSGFGYNPEMVIRLDPSRLEALGWQATTGLSEMFARMVAAFR